MRQLPKASKSDTVYEVLGEKFSSESFLERNANYLGQIHMA